MPNLDEFLQLQPQGSPLPGASPLDTATRPTASGLKWLTAPASTAGLAYRCSGNMLERLQVGEDSITVTASCLVEASAVQIAASSDGRLVAVAGADGSLQCFDSTSTTLSHRWTIQNAHSHTVSTLSASPSGDRSHAAAASGPVRSLAFAPSSYQLLLLDYTTLSIYNAVVDAPSVLVSYKNATSAAWASTPTSTGVPVAVGKVDGSVEILEFREDSKLEKLTEFGSPSEEEGFSCTHLDWNENTLFAGLCRVIPSEDEPDEDDEDDTAEHEACLYVTTVDSSSFTNTSWSELGDIVPFFSVPKSGRHVYFTSVLRSKQNLVIVASNVGSDIEALYQEGSQWESVDFQEGFAATTPLDEEDEYTYPVGAEVVQLPSGSFRLLLPATDGSTTLFSFENENDPSCFATKTTKNSDPLPDAPVDVVESDASPPELSAEPPVAEAPAPSTSTTSTSASPFTFGASSGTTSTAFGAPAPAPALSGFGATATSTTSAFGSSTTFGSGSASGLTFGKGTSSTFSFGSSGFGTTSSLGAAASATTKETPKSTGPSFGSTTFGSSSGASSGGFGALATSPSTSGIFASNQFNAFQRPNDTSKGMQAKPLFGSAPAPAPKDTAAKNTSTSTSTTSTFAFGQSAAKPSPFSAFSSSSSTTTITPAAGIATPLFGASKKEETPPVPKEETATTTPSSSEPLSATAKKAAKVFDTMDKDKTGSLPVSAFEELLEELGEGFFGEEYDAQVKLIDPSSSGKLARASFIDWYTTLVEGGGDEDDDDGDSMDSEKAEEEAKARKCFGALSTTEGGIRMINVKDMEKLITSLGSTYGEDEFRKVLKKLTKPGDKIHEDDFVSWYVDWLFGDDDSDFEDDEEDDENDDGGTGGAGASSSEQKQDLSSLFQVAKDSWKCEVCSVRNAGSLKKCSACETPRPGFEEEASNEKEPAGGASAAGSIGSGGFSFGNVGGGSIGSGGFSFGGSAGADTGSSSKGEGSAAAAAPSVGFSFGGSSGGGSAVGTSGGSGKGGFTFGGGSGGAAAAPSSGFTFGAKGDAGASSKASTGLSFGAPAPAPAPAPAESQQEDKKSIPPTTPASPISEAGKKAAKVFDTMDKDKTGSLPVSAFEELLEELGEGFFGEEYDAQVKLIDPSSSGKLLRASFIDWYTTLVEGGGDEDDDDGDSMDSEKAEEEAKARKCFGALSTTEGGIRMINVKDMEKLITSLGSTYGEDEFRKVLKKLTKPGDKIHEDDFVSWYVDWLFGDDDSDFEDDEEDDENDDGGTGGAGASSSEQKQDLSSLFQVAKDSWKCEVCSVRNAGSLKKCSACETPRPGFEEEASNEKEPAGGASAAGSIGSGGFSFGNVGGGSIGSGGFSFGGSAGADTGSSSKGEGSAAAAAPSVGFSFGGSSGGGSAVGTSGGSGKGGFTFGGGSGGAAAAPSSGFTFGTKGDTGASSKAPSGFSFGAPAPAEKTGPTPSKGSSSSGSYPPMSSKAPTPFGTSAPKPSSGGSTGSYPPMSAKAPTPFGASAPKPAASKGGGAYPPMSNKAPTPFGSAPKKDAAPPFPPMSAKAPTPFGASAPKPAASKGGGAYPPMSNKAPTPFGTAPKKDAAPPFPPMSAKAPTPFGASAPKPAASKGGGAYPPMSNKAPTPFGTAPKKDAAPPFPPMSAKAPTPFGASAPKPAASKGGGAYPPMSNKAPTPFGSAPKKDAAPPFPPMSAKAPTPFGASAPKPAASKGGGAYPPMSNKAPTPFGTAPKKDAAPPFPPMSAKAPTPFGAQPNKAVPAGAASTQSPPRVQTRPAIEAKSKSRILGSGYPRKERSSVSRIEQEFMKLCSQMEESVQRAAGFKLMMQEKTADMDTKITAAVGRVQQARSELIGVDADLIATKEESMFLFSRKTDASRQVTETQRLVETITSKSKGVIKFAEEQPLDYESEHTRRKLAREAREFKDRLEVVQERLELLTSASESTSDSMPILKSAMSYYEDSKLLGQVIQRIDDNLSKTSSKVPLQSSVGKNSSGGRTTYGLTPEKRGSARKARLRPLSFEQGKQSAPSIHSKPQVEPDFEKWDKLEAQIQERGQQQVSTIRVGRRAMFLTPGKPTGADERNTIALRGRSLLLSPTAQGQSTSTADAITNVTNLFSPTKNSTPRKAWGQMSDIDQKRLKELEFALPTDLKETSVASRARGKLVAVGTTPEKVQASVKLKRENALGLLTSNKGGSTTKGQSPASTSKITAAAFPPLPSKAPTPFSQQGKDSKAAKPPKPKPSSAYPPMAAAAPKPFSAKEGATAKTEQKESQSTDKQVPEGGTSESNNKKLSPFGGMKAMSGSLFDTSTTTKGSSSFSSAPGAGGGTSTASTSTGSSFPSLPSAGGASRATTNYREVLTNFYQKHNPNKIGEIDKTLEKYRGREIEMFNKLAAKYKVPSPLESVQQVKAPTSAGGTTPITGMSAPASGSKSPFGSSMTTAGTTSNAFGASTTPATPSPFGGTPSGGFASASPFGSNAATTPFGTSAAPSPSPFGAPSAPTMQASPFGAQATPTVAPMQTPGTNAAKFNGRTPRDLLLSFYQEKNPSKVAEVDKVLQKYRGNEEQLFRNLAKKYQMDPSVFGISAGPNPGSFGGGGFGSTSPASFGQQSTLGGGPSPFGQPSSLGGPSAATAPSFGTTTNSTGSAFGSVAASSGFGASGFGSLAGSASPSPFGGGGGQSAFGSAAPSFGSPQSGAFGGATPFGAARR